MSRFAIITAILLALLMAATAAFARPDRAGRGQGERGPRPMFGEIIAIGGDSITIAPAIPEFIKEKMAEAGRELPTDLPGEITVGLTGDTEYYYAGETASLDVFDVGEMVVIAPGGTKDNPTARIVADEESAKQYIMQRIRERAGQGGRGQDGQGRRGGEGGPGMRGGGQRGMRPVFGEIIAIDGDTVTIRPEVPGFIQAKLDEQGIDREFELPAEVTLEFGERTRYVQDSAEVESNPYTVGDYVAVIAGRGRNSDSPVILGISDYASAEAKMEERCAEREGPGGEGRGLRPGRGGQGGQGNRGGFDGGRGPGGGPRR